MVWLIYMVFIVVLICVALPALLVISLSIWVLSGLPIIFTQKRVGRNGRIFTLYKFRTMKNGADREQPVFGARNEANGPVFKIRNDPRFTNIGRFLSHTGLDELPQLWNVLRGDMSLIGPRPLPISEEAKLTPWQKKREIIKPGIISPWILTGYHRQSFDQWMKSDIEYAKKKSLIVDLSIFAQSIIFLVSLFFREVLSEN